MTYHEILNTALKLAPGEREQLAAALLASVEDASRPLTDIDQAWIDEAERRLDEYERDPSVAVSAKQMHAEIKRKYGWK